MEFISTITNDQYLLPLIQLLFVLFGFYAINRDRNCKKSSSGFNASLKRGPQSMSIFHSTYVALAFLIVLVTLNVKAAENHKVFFLLLNIGLLAYLCFWNVWFRNKLMGLIIKVSELEK